MADIACRMRVYGRVQGVGFRDWTRSEARSRGLAGWCRNREDGSVEIEISGERDAVQDLRDILEKGPTASRVDKVEVEPIEGPLSFPFEIRSSG